MDISREDWLLIFIVAAGVLPLGYGLMNSGGFTPQTPIEKECVSHAAAVEANATFADRIDGCKCIPPDKVDENRFRTPERVKNASTLFLIQCKLDDGQGLTFPVWRVKDGYADTLNQTNGTTVLGEDQR